MSLLEVEIVEYERPDFRGTSDTPVTPRPVGTAAFIAWYRTPVGQELTRYAMVSIIATITAQVTLTLVYGVLGLPSAVLSSVIANVAAAAPAYTLHRRWVWGKSGQSHWLREIVPFWATAAVTVACSIAVVGAAAHFGKAHHLHHVTLTALVDTVSLGTQGILWVLKFFVFRMFFRAAPARQSTENGPDTSWAEVAA